MIKEEILYSYGAVQKHLSKHQRLFDEGDAAIFYYQILSGIMKMNNYTEEGKEVIQGLFYKGESFGEPAILGDFPFPANAVAVEDSALICLEKHSFLKLLKDKPEIGLELMKILSKRLRFKAILSKEVKGYDAEHQIMTLLSFLKESSGTEGDYIVDITRQTIADLTGLRVETVIRAIRNLKGKGRLSVKDRKLHI